MRAVQLRIKRHPCDVQKAFSRCCKQWQLRGTRGNQELKMSNKWTQDCRLHCNSGHCSKRTLADRLRRDGAPQSQWVSERATELTCDVCESRKPLQPRDRASFEYETKLWSQVRLACIDLSLEPHNTVDVIWSFSPGHECCTCVTCSTCLTRKSAHA